MTAVRGPISPSPWFLGSQTWLSHHAIWLVLLVLVVAGVLASPVFPTLNNSRAVADAMSVLGLLAIGQTFVLVAGGMDLSVGMLMGLIVVVTNGVMNGRSEMAIPAAALGLLIGLAGGLLNGLLITLVRIHPLILTYGMLSVLQGVIFLYTDRSVGQAPAQFVWLANGSLGGLHSRRPP